jgi:hypothetical protein
VSSALNLNIRAQRQLIHSNASPNRLWLLGENLVVDRVHGSKVLHVGKEDVDFNDLKMVRSFNFNSNVATIKKERRRKTHIVNA